MGEPRAVGVLPSTNAWMSETFRLTIDRAGHLFTLIVILLVPLDAIMAVLLWFALPDMVLIWDETQFVAEGIGPLAWVALALSVVGLVFRMALAAASARHVLAARTGVPEPWSDSLAGLARRVPRLVGATIILALMVLALSLVAGGFMALNPGMGLLAFAIGLVMLAVRAGYGPIAAVISPSWWGGVRAGLALTRGRTVALLGRFFLLGLVVTTMFLIGAIFGGAFGPTVTPDGNEIRMAELLGNDPAAFGLSQLLTTLVHGATIALAGGALGLLLADLGAPIDDSITDVADDADL